MDIIVLSGYGLNCEEETLFAFIKAAENLSSNMRGCIVHVNEVIANTKLLKSCKILAIPGGFSYGDDTGAGNAFALHILNNLREEIQDFLISDKLVIGICNGCQILTKLIPEFSEITLKCNRINQYQCQWIKVKVSQKRKSFWLQDLRELYLPVAHGEGNFYVEKEKLSDLIDNDMIALRYINKNGEYANQKFPINPNGSIYDIAALSDKSGRVLAMMPHPERAIFLTQQDNWLVVKEQYSRLSIPMPIYGNGIEIFCNGIRYFY